MKKLFFWIIIFFSFNVLFAQSIDIYEFEPGFYHMLDFPVNIRSQPNTSSSIIGKLELNYLIEIISKTSNTQTIDNITHYWYRIKFGDLEGFVWGGYIAVKSKAFNIDGVQFKCYYRISHIEKFTLDIGSYWSERIFPNDIYVYRNNIRISNKVFENKFNDIISDPEFEGWGPFCSIGASDNRIIFFIDCYMGPLTTIRFEVNREGEITFLGFSGM